MAISDFPGEIFIYYISIILSWVGIIIITYGGLYAAFRIFQREALKKPIRYNERRLNLTNKIVFGLEFFIAADILTTLIAPSADELILLGAVVVIRTVLGYFLEKEAEEFRVD
jgi:uncharacterized membrane protein